MSLCCGEEYSESFCTERSEAVPFCVEYIICLSVFILADSCLCVLVYVSVWVDGFCVYGVSDVVVCGVLVCGLFG